MEDEDMSMDEILASIRKYVTDDQLTEASKPTQEYAPVPDHEVIHVDIDTNRHLHVAQTQAPEPVHFQDEPIAKETMQASTAAMSKLMGVVKAQGPAIQVQPSQTSALTLDKLMIELAKPMIKEWLDRNLATIVENRVAIEIEKITQGMR